MTPINGMLIFAPEESLFFANVDAVRVQISNRLAAVVSAAPVATDPSLETIRTVLLDPELTNESDVPSADMLGELHDDLAAAGAQLLLARARPAVRDMLDRCGVTAKIGAEHIYDLVWEGALFHLSAEGTQTESLLGLSPDGLVRLEQVVDEMTKQAQGVRRTQLDTLARQLRRAIDQEKRD